MIVKNIKIGQKEGVQKDLMTTKQNPSSTSVRKDNDVLFGPKILDQEVPPQKSIVVAKPARNKDILERVDLIEPNKTMDILERVDLLEDEGINAI